MTLTPQHVLHHGRTLIQIAVKAARDALDRLDAGVLFPEQALHLVAQEKAAITHGTFALHSLLVSLCAMDDAAALITAKDGAMVEIGCLEDAVRLFMTPPKAEGMKPAHLRTPPAIDVVQRLLNEDPPTSWLGEPLSRYLPPAAETTGVAPDRPAIAASAGGNAPSGRTGL